MKSNLIIDKCIHCRCSRMSIVLSGLYMLTPFTEELNVYYLMLKLGGHLSQVLYLYNLTLCVAK